MVGTNRPQRDKCLLLAHATCPLCVGSRLSSVSFLSLPGDPGQQSCHSLEVFPLAVVEQEERVEKHC